jgi:hypothetical protein
MSHNGLLNSTIMSGRSLAARAAKLSAGQRRLLPRSRSITRP